MVIHGRYIQFRLLSGLSTRLGDCLGIPRVVGFTFSALNRHNPISINMFILRSVVFVILVYFSVTSVPNNHYPVRPTDQRHEGNHFWLKTTFPLAKTFGYFQRGQPTQNRGRNKICMPGMLPDQVLPRGRQAWTTKLLRKRRTKSRVCY